MKRKNNREKIQVDSKSTKSSENDPKDGDEFIIDEDGHECFSPVVFIRKVQLFEPSASYSSKEKWHEHIKNRLQELQDPYVLIDKSDPAVAFALMINRLLFIVESDAVHAINAFITAHEANLYPPLWVLNFLYEIFSQWQKQDCKESLDKLLGLKGLKRRGKRVSYTEAINLTKRNHELSDEVYCLKFLFDFKLYEACEAVSERRKETHKEYVYPKTLETIYIKKFSKNFEKDDFLRESLRKWTNEEKAQFLRTFPEESLPQKNRQRFEKYLNLTPIKQ